MIIQRIKDIVQSKAPFFAKRSKQWSEVRKAYIAINDYCAVCGGQKKMEVHHVQPFHLHPELELEAGNLITLCEAKKKGINCHLFFGHLGNYRSFNSNVKNDAPQWRYKINNRPSLGEENK